MNAGSTLRILDEKRFEVVWTDDGWQTKHTTASRSLGSAGFSADIAPRCRRQGSGMDDALAGVGRWLGYNVKVKVDAAKHGDSIVRGSQPSPTN